MKITRLQADSRTSTGESWQLDARRWEAVIGREEGVGIRLDDPSVSLRHATVIWQNGALTLMDNGSINGVTLRNRRIRRAEFTREEVVLVGAVPLRIQPEAGDRVARIRAMVLRGTVCVMALVVLLIVLGVVRDFREKPAAPVEAEIEPLRPPTPDEARAAEYRAMLESYQLADKATALLALSTRDPEAAALLIASMKKFDYPENRVHELLKGLQGKHYPQAAERIRGAVAAGDFEAAREAYEGIAVYYMEVPPELAALRRLIDGNIRYREALVMLEEGRLEEAEEILDGLNGVDIAGLAGTRQRLARIREAMRWVNDISDAVDAGDFQRARALLGEEADYVDFLTASLRDDLGAAKFRLFHFGELLALMEAGNTYVLAERDFDMEVLFIQEPLAKLRDQLLGRVNEIRADAEAAVGKAGDPAVPPVDAAEALAARDAAHAYASLYILDPGPGTRARYETFRTRWQTYLAALFLRLRGYEDRGANDEIRAILAPFLPELDADDTACFPLFALADRLKIGRGAGD